MTAKWETIVQIAKQGEPLAALDRTELNLSPYHDRLRLLSLNADGHHQLPGRRPGRGVSQCLGGVLVVSADVSVMSWSRYWWLGTGVSVVSCWCLAGALVVSWWCLAGVSLVSVVCLGGVSVVSVVVSWWCRCLSAWRCALLMVSRWRLHDVQVVSGWCLGGASVVSILREREIRCSRCLGRI